MAPRAGVETEMHHFGRGWRSYEGAETEMYNFGRGWRLRRTGQAQSRSQLELVEAMVPLCVVVKKCAGTTPDPGSNLIKDGPRPVGALGPTGGRRLGRYCYASVWSN